MKKEEHNCCQGCKIGQPGQNKECSARLLLKKKMEVNETPSKK